MAGPVKILLIDDDEDDNVIFVRALNKISADVDFTWAESGDEAIKGLTEQRITTPDFIFLDLNMPRMDGKQVLRELGKLKDFARIKICIYSTSKINRDADEIRELGASYFLTKPYNLSDLCTALLYLLNPEKEKYTDLLEKYLLIL
jgi:CheY-like chemotaxis protein